MDDPGVILAPRTPEQLHDGVVAVRAGDVGGKDRGFSPERDDLATDALECLPRGFVVRQNVHGVACLDGPHLLQAAPRLDAHG